MQVFSNRKNFQFDALFQGLPAPVARDFALMLREFASFLDMQADDQEERSKRRDENIDQYHWMKSTLPRMMNEALKRHTDIDRASLDVAGRTGIQPITVIHYWKRHELMQAEAERQKRNLAIYSLYRERRPQAEIAQVIGVSQSTVSRVINRHSARN